MNISSENPCILVPIDLSDVTGRVVETAALYARALGARLHLLHVREALPMMVPQEDLGVVPMLQPMAAPVPLAEDEVDRLAPWRERLSGRGLTIEATELHGAVVHEIEKHASDLSATLIVLGSHGHGAMYELLVGSVAHGVLKNTPCPVLIVPAARKA